MTTAQERNRDPARAIDTQTGTQIGTSLEVIRHEPFNAETPERALVHELTPTPNAYIRTNFGVAAPATPHVIDVGGAVRAHGHHAC